MLSDRSGIALILTLWILAALIVLALGLGMTARTEVQIARNYSEQVQCRWAARAGINVALAQVDELVKQPSISAEDVGAVMTSEDVGIELEDATFDVRIEDEAGKLNVNVVPIQAMEALFGSPEVADCIADWRDEDNTPRSLGAEDQYYSGLPSPYEPRNGPLDTVGELSLVKGISDDLLDTRPAGGGRALRDMVTVYSHDKNTAADGQARVNINTASKEDLKSRFGDVLIDQEIDAIISQRQGGVGGRDIIIEGHPMVSLPRRETRQTSAPPMTLSPMPQSGFASVGEIIRVPGLSREKVRQIFDRITVNNDEERPGLVNVNTASAEVLASVPGLDDAIADAIIAYRGENGQFADVGELLAVIQVTDEAFAQAADYLTTRSGVFKIIATGRSSEDRSSYSITCVVDASSGKAQIRYWQE